MGISKEAKAAYDRARRASMAEELSAQKRAAAAARTPEQKAKQSAYNRAYYAAHREEARAYAIKKRDEGYYREWERKRRLADPEGQRRAQQKWRLKSKYGISIETYDAMLAAQGGVCAICGRAESMAIKGTTCTLAVDHDHDSKRVRGLLCVNCNMLIGGARHDPVVLRAAIAYLERPA
jgi:hypothetical protein